MSAGRKLLEPAYVIHRRPFSDTSLIVELLTPAHGRVSVLAKGVKRGKAQKALLLQPFRSLHVAWIGRGELPVLTTAEEAGQMLHLQGESLACAYYVNELIYHLVPKFEPAADLFTHYWSTLQGCKDISLRACALRSFEVSLLEQIGLAPTLGQDIVSGQPIDSSKNYFYRVPEGPVPAASAKGNGIEVSGATLQNIADRDFSKPETLRQAKHLNRALIHYHLDGKELMSRALMKNFRKLKVDSQ